VRRTWALRGRPPRLKRLSKRRELSSLIAITPAGQLAACHVEGSVHGPDVIRALKHCRRRFGRPLLIVWDRLNAHRDRRVQAFLAAHARDFATHELPAYAPELNPEEQANAVIKARTANALPADIAELKAHACRAVRHLQRHPEMVRNFFRHAGLHVH
jgi:hypothetical protein